MEKIPVEQRLRCACCDNCGQELGAGTWYPNEFKSCGEPDCERAARDADAAERDEAAYRAAQDDYERYR